MSKSYIAILLLLSISLIHTNNGLKFLETISDKDIDELDDVKLTFEQIVIKKGYPLSTYYVNTEDGYILKIYRISGPKNSSINEKQDPNKRVVLLQHGIFDSSDSWVSNHENKSLAFILANLGYDVWLGNNRGNKHSRNHKTLNPNKDKAFWNYSFHEMGMYDIPASLDFIKKQTGVDKITYIGHSQGTTQMFAGLSRKLDYYKTVLNGFIALGPVTNLKNIGSSFLKIVAKTNLDSMFNVLGINELLDSNQAVEKLQLLICKNVGILCSGLLSLIADANVTDDDMDRFLVFIGHFPSGTSLKSLIHFADNVRNGWFVEYDNKNPYKLEEIRDIPIGLFVGKDDMLATVNDNRVLKDILNKDILKFYKEYDNMGHATFFLSKTNSHVEDLLRFLDNINS